MSVKFQKETVSGTAPLVGRDNDTVHKIGEALTGGKSQTGYLAVSRVPCQRTRPKLIHHHRHTFSSSSRIRSEQRCSHLAPCPLCKNFSHRGWRMTRAN